MSSICGPAAQLIEQKQLIGSATRSLSAGFIDMTLAAKTILVVEDEPLLRELSVSELKHAGYDVLEAPTAVEALEILASGVAVALVFTDVNMPGGLDGLQLSDLVRDRWPQVRLIVTSGGGQVGASDVRPPGRFIPKPYPLDQMIAAVRDLAGDPA